MSPSGSDSAEAGTSTHARRLFLAVVGIALLTLLRSFNFFVLPSMPFEDGKIMFAYYLNHPEPSSIFRSYAGYISLLPNLIGYVSTRFDPRLAPYLMGAYSLAIATLAMSIFASRQFRYLLKSDDSRILICLVLVALPLGNFALFSMTTYTNWHLFWILLLLSVAPLPVSHPARVVQMSFLALAAWSHPYSILIIPVFIARLFIIRTASDRAASVFMILVIGAYAVIGIEGSGEESTVGVRTLFVAVNYILHRVVFESVFGNLGRFALHHLHLDWLVVGVSFLLLVGIVYGAFKTRAHLARVHVFWIVGSALLVGLLTCAAAVGRNMGVEDYLSQYGHRYFYIQQRLFVLAILIWMARALPGMNGILLSRKARRAALAAVCAYLVMLNAMNVRYFFGSWDEGRRMRAFLSELSQQFGGPVSARPSELVLARPDGWDVRVDLEKAR